MNPTNDLSRSSTSNHTLRPDPALKQAVNVKLKAPATPNSDVRNLRKDPYRSEAGRFIGAE